MMKETKVNDYQVIHYDLFSQFRVIASSVMLLAPVIDNVLAFLACAEIISAMHKIVQFY